MASVATRQGGERWYSVSDARAGVTGTAGKGTAADGGGDAKQPSPGDGSKLTSGQWLSVFIVVILILIAFALFSAVMFRSADDAAMTEIIWNRRIYIFAAAEAITFTAVGWLFGREVNRARAESAEKSAASAKKDAKEAQEETMDKMEKSAAAEAKGQSLAGAVVTSARNAGSQPAELEGVVGAALGASNSQLKSLADLAELLYPELNR